MLTVCRMRLTIAIVPADFVTSTSIGQADKSLAVAPFHLQLKLERRVR